MGIESYYVTFGVQYTNDETTGEVHPLGMHKDGYALIEAPDMETARAMAFAIFDEKYAFIYDWNHFFGDGTYNKWYWTQAEPLLTIRWIQP